MTLLIFGTVKVVCVAKFILVAIPLVVLVSGAAKVVCIVDLVLVVASVLVVLVPARVEVVQFVVDVGKVSAALVCVIVCSSSKPTLVAAVAVEGVVVSTFPFSVSICTPTVVTVVRNFVLVEYSVVGRLV